MPTTSEILKNRYEVLELIGKGFQGIIHKARCVAEGVPGVAVGELVAIKRIRSIGEQQEALNFRRESETLRRLNHPNIVAYKDSFDYHEETIEGKVYCLVTELLDGDNLKIQIERHPKGIPWTQVGPIFLQTLEALQHTSSQKPKVVHRDLKPSNIFVTKQGVAKLIDFGIARDHDDDATFSTAGAKGTFDYMAPDFARIPKFHGDEQSDIFSFGVCLYHALTGSLPFEPLGGDIMAFYTRWHGNKVTETKFRNPSFRLLGRARSFIENCINPNRESRFQSFEQALVEFRRIGFRKLQHGKETYEFLEYLGKGGFGEVFRARRWSDQRDVAVKHLFSARYARRFVREAKILREAKHPHLTEYVDFVEVPFRDDEKEYFLILAYLEGMPAASLRYRLKATESGMNPAEVIPLFIGYLDCLEHLHRQGIVHRDIKPANLYAPEGHPELGKIFDLGIAHDDEGTRTHGQVPGTLDYMPPEFATQDKGRGSPQSDIYSIGVTLYQALTRELPFPRLPELESEAWGAFYERAGTSYEVSYEHPVFKAKPDLVYVLSRSLDLNPDQRFVSAIAMRDALQRMLDREVAVEKAKAEAKVREEARLRAEAEAKRIAAEKAKVEAEAKERELARQKAGAEAARLAEEKQIAAEKAWVEAKEREKALLKAQAEAKRLVEEKAKAEAQAKEREEARLRAEAEAKRIAAEKTKAEAEAKRQAEEKAKTEAKARELARQKAGAEAARFAEEKQIAAEKAWVEAKEREKARLKAEAEAKRLVEEKAKAQAQAKEREEARLKAEAEAKRIAAEKAKAEAEAKRQAEEQAKAEAKARELARQKAGAEVARLAEEKQMAAEKAWVEAKEREKVRVQAEAQARRLAEKKRLEQEDQTHVVTARGDLEEAATVDSNLDRATAPSQEKLQPIELPVQKEQPAVEEKPRKFGRSRILKMAAVFFIILGLPGGYLAWKKIFPPGPVIPPPTFVDCPPQVSMDPTNDALQFSFVISDPQTPAAELEPAVALAPASLAALAKEPGTNAASWIVKVSRRANEHGSGTVSVRVKGKGGKTSQTIALTIAPLPLPDIVECPPQLRLEPTSNGLQFPLVVSDYKIPSAELSPVITIDPPGLATIISKTWTSGSNWLVTLARSSEIFGPGMISVQVAGKGGTTNRTVGLTVLQMPPPALQLQNQEQLVLQPDLSSLNLNFVVHDQVMPATNLRLWAETPSDLVALTVQRDSEGAKRLVTLTRNNRKSGTARIMVNISAGLRTNSLPLDVKVEPLPPLPDAFVLQGDTSVHLDVNAADLRVRIPCYARDPKGLVFESSQPNLVPTSSIRFEPATAGDTNGFITFEPLHGFKGEVAITVRATAPQSVPTAKVIHLTLDGELVPPVQNPVLHDLTLEVGGSFETNINLSSMYGFTPEQLTFTASNDNPAFASLGIVGGGAVRTVKITPLSEGSAEMKLVLATPNGSSVTQPFRATILPPLPPQIELPPGLSLTNTVTSGIKFGPIQIRISDNATPPKQITIEWHPVAGHIMESDMKVSRRDTSSNVLLNLEVNSSSDLAAADAIKFTATDALGHSSTNLLNFVFTPAQPPLIEVDHSPSLSPTNAITSGADFGPIEFKITDYSALLDKMKINLPVAFHRIVATDLHFSTNEQSSNVVVHFRVSSPENLTGFDTLEVVAIDGLGHRSSRALNFVCTTPPDSYTNCIGMTLCWVPKLPGTGAGDWHGRKGGRWVGQYEVKQKEFEAVLKNKVSNPSINNKPGSDFPVENMSMSQARQFCDELTRMDQANLPSGWRYVMPSENQWEFLAQDTPLDTAHANFIFSDPTAQTPKPAGRPGMVANGLGLYDVLGNVAELTTTLWPGFNNHYVCRGGAFSDGRNELSTRHATDYESHRYWHFSGPDGKTGFRVILAP